MSCGSVNTFILLIISLRGGGGGGGFTLFFCET